MVRLTARVENVVARLGRVGQLSARELRIAGLVTAGWSYRDIASSLRLSERTVETHVQNILAKLGYHSRAQVAAWAASHGIVGADIT